MKALNLVANGNEQTRIKDYLQNNVGDELANKINNGVEITLAVITAIMLVNSPPKYGITVVTQAKTPKSNQLG